MCSIESCELLISRLSFSAMMKWNRVALGCLLDLFPTTTAAAAATSSH
jgi:hypothetical protein